jgi:hypothetical protein
MPAGCSRSPDARTRVRPQDFKSLIIYDLDPRLTRIDEAAKRQATRRELTASEMKLLSKVRWRWGEPRRKGRCLAEATLTDGTHVEVLIGYTGPTTLGIQGQSGYWETYGELTSFILDVLKQDFVPARRTRGPTSTPSLDDGAVR